MTTDKWTIERNQLVRQRHEDGRTYSEIADELGESFNRNMVASRVRKLGLKPRKKTTHPWGQKAKTKPVPVVVTEPIGNGIRLLDRNMHRQCAWPYPDVDGEAMCCGAPRRGGSIFSFCEWHDRIGVRRPVTT